MRVPMALCCVAVVLAAAARPMVQPAPDPVRAGVAGVPVPSVLGAVEPVYPRIAQQAQVHGIVVVEVVVGTDGHVQQARVTRSIPLLDQSALDAVRQWTFAPTFVGDAPVRVVTPVSVEFVLGTGPPPAVPPFPPERTGSVPADFSFRYVVSCRPEVAMPTIRIEPDGFTSLTSPSPQGVRTPIEFSPAEWEAIYTRLVAADAFSAPGAPVPVPGTQRAADRLEVTVVGELPYIWGFNGGPLLVPHDLDLWHDGTSRRLSWRVRSNAPEQVWPETQRSLAAVGALIRSIVAQKPAVRELPSDERPCLED